VNDTVEANNKIIWVKNNCTIRMKNAL